MKIKVLFGAFLISLHLVLAYGQEVKVKKIKAIEKTPVAAKAAATPLWNPDGDAFGFGDSLPKNYDGASAEGIVKWVLKKAIQEKGEYEKQADYEKRVSEAEELLKEKVYAFDIKVGLFYEKYDADQGVFIPRKSIITSDQKEFTLARNSKEFGSYVASNAYGNSVVVKKIDYEEFGIYLTKNDLMKTEFFKEDIFGIQFEYNLAVPIEKAKLIKASDISMLAVGYVGVRNLKHNRTCLSPKIGSPYEGCVVSDYLPLTLKKVYVYHKPSGEVLAIKDIE